MIYNALRNIDQWTILFTSIGGGNGGGDCGGMADGMVKGKGEREDQEPHGQIASRCGGETEV